MDTVSQWFNETFLLLSYWQWIGLTVFLVLGFFSRLILRFVFAFFAKRNTKNSYYKDFLDYTTVPLSWIFAGAIWWIGINIVDFQGQFFKILYKGLQIQISICLIWLAYNSIDVLKNYLVALTKKTKNTLDDQLVPFVIKILKVSTVIVGTLVILQNLGLNVASLLAGLGIGGLAFAFAAKDTVANFFGSIMILLDHPFEIGDVIVVKDIEGTVLEIGFRSTRIMTFYNSVLTVPNSYLATENIDNLGKRKQRRVKTILGVTYDTPPEKLEAFVQGIKGILDNHPTAKKDNYHVAFNDYADSSLNILLYFHLEVSNWKEELLEREKVLVKILKLAQEQSVSFAFPSRSLYIETPVKTAQT